MTALWIYKCNAGRKGTDGIRFGDWGAFFDRARSGPVEWGFTSEIKGASSRKIIRDDMRVSDLVLAWQTDRRQAVGLCRVADITVQGHPDRSPDRVLVLETVRQFTDGVRLLDMKAQDAELASVAALGERVVPATLYATTADEAAVVLDRCGVDPAVLDG